MPITVRTIVKGAMKKLGVLPIGREPTSPQAQDALEALQALYRELVGQGVFGRLYDVLVTTATYSAREQERVVCDLVSGVTVTLPETITQSLIDSAPYRCFTYDVNAPDYGRGCWSSEVFPRPPRDGACIVVADVNSSLEKYYLYDANRAYWVLLDSLTLDSTAPLSARYQNGLEAVLSERLADPFGVDVPKQATAQANTFRHSISMKLDRSRRPVIAEYF